MQAKLSVMAWFGLVVLGLFWAAWAVLRRRLARALNRAEGLGPVTPLASAGPRPLVLRPESDPESEWLFERRGMVDHPSYASHASRAARAARAAHPAAGGLHQPRAIPVQLLFATPSDVEDVVVLDCIAGADATVAGMGLDAPLRQGMPFTVKADLTCTAQWATVMIETLLDRWTDMGTPVQMVFLDGSAGPEVRLFDQDSRVQLPLAA